jgi:hypothetical protein
MGALPGHASIKLGPINGIFDSTATTGIHALHSVAGSKYIVTVALGDRAAPAAGVPVFCGEWYQNGYTLGAEGEGLVPATLEMGEWAVNGETLDYPRAWGKLLHPSSAATAVNSGTANEDNGAASTKGGYGVLHLLAGNGTATFTIEHSAVDADGDFDSTGAIITFDTTAAATPFSEIKATAAVTTTINRYTRWQVALGTATTLTFVMSLVRGT